MSLAPSLLLRTSVSLVAKTGAITITLRRASSSTVMTSPRVAASGRGAAHIHANEQRLTAMNLFDLSDATLGHRSTPVIGFPLPTTFVVVPHH
jgi:hypothetical protein